MVAHRCDRGPSDSVGLKSPTHSWRIWLALRHDSRIRSSTNQLPARRLVPSLGLREVQPSAKSWEVWFCVWVGALSGRGDAEVEALGAGFGYRFDENLVAPWIQVDWDMILVESTSTTVWLVEDHLAVEPDA